MMTFLYAAARSRVSSPWDDDFAILDGDIKKIKTKTESVTLVEKKALASSTTQLAWFSIAPESIPLLDSVSTERDNCVRTKGGNGRERGRGKSPACREASKPIVRTNCLEYRGIPLA